jgi:ubiquitin carboxyl-terminal hydrolase 7
MRPERRIDEERVQFEARKKEREEQHLFLTAKVCFFFLVQARASWFLFQVVTDDTFTNHDGFDLANFDEKSWLPLDLPTFRVPKQENYSTFKRRVAQHFNYPENQIRLWVLIDRANKTVRPEYPIPENEPAMSPPKFTLFYSNS